jgi:hypothetical protein
MSISSYCVLTSNFGATSMTNPQFSVGQILVGKRVNYKFPYIKIREVWFDLVGSEAEGEYFYDAYSNHNLLLCLGSAADDFDFVERHYNLYTIPYSQIWNQLND